MSLLKRARLIIITLLLLAFFMPWISYGYISKSGFAIPFSPYELESMLKLVFLFEPQLKAQIEIPKELFYLYLLYLYPLLVSTLLFIRWRWFVILVGLIPIVPYFIASSILPMPLFTFMGIGFILTLLLSALLIVQSLLSYKIEAFLERYAKLF